MFTLFKEKIGLLIPKGDDFMVNKKADKLKSNLTATQQVLYSHEFKHADRVGGFTEKKARR